MMKIVFASHNKNKLKQIKQLLPQFEVLGLSEVGIEDDIEETANSYRGNAELKARHTFYKTGLVCMADDSGLSIDAFDGWPGINTHRFLGENSSRDERNDLILSKLKGIKNRECSVICSICVIDKHGNAFFKEGIFDGQISTEKMGDNKFGFDEIIMHEGKTLAQMTDDEKLKINARSLAIGKMLPKLNELALEYKNDIEKDFAIKQELPEVETSQEKQIKVETPIEKTETLQKQQIEVDECELFENKNVEIKKEKVD